MEPRGVEPRSGEGHTRVFYMLILSLVFENDLEKDTRNHSLATGVSQWLSNLTITSFASRHRIDWPAKQRPEAMMAGGVVRLNPNNSYLVRN